jgi:hypothetical protein
MRMAGEGRLGQGVQERPTWLQLATRHDKTSMVCEAVHLFSFSHAVKQPAHCSRHDSNRPQGVGSRCGLARTEALISSLPRPRLSFSQHARRSTASPPW